VAMKKRTIIYDPSMLQDFANIQVRGRPIPSDFNYVHKNWAYRILATVFYRVIAVPILYCFSKIKWHIRVENKKEIMKQLKGTGYFIYSNHTLTADGWIPACFICPPKRAYIVSLGGTFTANRFIGLLISQLGAIPLPGDFKSARNFMHCLKKRLDDNCPIAIYPEGTIWPYYTKARVTKEGAFKYPRVFNKPIVFACSTFRKPRGLFKRFKAPRVVITLSNPIFPNRSSVEKIDEKRLKELFDQFIEKTTANPLNYSPYNYVQKELDKDYLNEHFDETFNEFNKDIELMSKEE